MSSAVGLLVFIGTFALAIGVFGNFVAHAAKAKS
jgi:hypothetical protein